MKRFIKKVMIFSVLIVLCMCGLTVFDCFVVGPQYAYNYQASLIDKVNRMESINEPKILLVGHSNLSFGIHSDEIEKELGMPVVNLGLHGGLGNAYHEQIAKLDIDKGDIVVVCHSSFSDEDIIVDPELAWITFDWNSQLWPIIRAKDYITMLTAYPGYLKKSLLRWVSRTGNKNVDSCNSRSAFNEYGDVIYKPEKDQVDVDSFFAQNPIAVPQINDICINRLNELNSYCQERGATLVVAGYPIAYGKYADFSEKDFDDFQAELEERLDCDVISHYSDYFYPYDYFYNTILHLTDEGAEVRTQQLISDLKNWLD